MDKTLDDSLVGHVLDGRYRVDSRIARGGMATVYLATDQRLERVVALKVMHPELARHDEFVSRFIREAKTAARLTHPNIVAVFDQSADGGHVYLVMEFVDGLTLRELLSERGRFTPREALDILAPVLSALGAAHRAGMVHRDVKPENVLIGREGSYAHAVKVADFGLARSAAAGATVSLAGMIVGTASYLAPEQVKSGICDARSDVYSAGIVLYELLTGTKPFVADTPIQVAYQHVHNAVPAPSGKVPGLDPALDALVVRATTKDPAGRPADANVLHAELMRTYGNLPDAALDFGAVPQQSNPDMAATAELAALAGQRHIAQTRVMPQPEATRAVPADPSPTKVQPAVKATTQLQKPPPKQVYKTRRSPNEPRVLVPADQGWRPSRGHIALAVIVVVAILLGLGAWWVTSGQYRSMPSVVREQRNAAVAELTKDGLHPDVVEAFDDAVPAGQVIGSSPAPAGKVKKGSNVRITVSKGPHPIPVPDQAGQSPDSATQALQAAGFKVQVSQNQVFSEDIDAGLVASRSPDTAQPGSVITLTISKGGQTYQVPNVTGLSEDDAKARLAAAGFTNVKVNKWFFGSTIYSQQPAAGAYARHKDQISIGENPIG